MSGRSQTQPWTVPRDRQERDALFNGLGKDVKALEDKLKELQSQRTVLMSWAMDQIANVPSWLQEYVLSVVNYADSYIQSAIQAGIDLVDASYVPFAIYADANRWAEIEGLALQLSADVNPLQQDPRYTYADSHAGDFEWTGRAASAYRRNLPHQYAAIKEIANHSGKTAQSMNQLFAAAAAVYAAWAACYTSILATIVRVAAGTILDAVGELITIGRLYLSAWGVEESARAVAATQAELLWNVAGDQSVIVPRVNGWPDPTQDTQFVRIEWGKDGKPYLEAGAGRIQRFNKEN